MKSAPMPLSRHDWTRLILGMTLLFSVAVRLFPLMLAGFPLNDGGMFLIMMRDLRANTFALPEFTTYNLSNIPFSYPPLGFYAGALLSVLGMKELEVLRWLPAAMNVASIPVFFLLSRRLLSDEPRAAVATLVYALVPGNFAWQIMGGGLTRSPGMLFILLANFSVHRMFEQGRWNWVWLSILFCSLAVLSHPEVGLATATSCALFWAFFGRNGRGSLQSLVVAFGTSLLTAPWWASVIAAHGLAPFQSVLHSGAYDANPFKLIVTQFFTFDLWTGLFHVLFLTGLAWSLVRRQYFFPLWMVLPYLVEPRSAGAFAYLPQSMLTAQVLMGGIPAALDWLRKGEKPERGSPDETQRKAANIVVFAVLSAWFLGSALYGFRLANTSLQPPQSQEVMAWAQRNVPAQAEFLILTGSSGIMTDPIQEWFPALAERKSRTTLQGLEWTLGEQFFPRLKQLADLQSCPDIQCVEQWSLETGLSYSHLLLEKNGLTKSLLESLHADGRYQSVYENDGYIIFKGQ